MSTHRLLVFYNHKDGPSPFWADTRIKEIVGEPSVGASTDMLTRERDIEFEMSKIEAEEAATRVRSLGFRAEVSERA